MAHPQQVVFCTSVKNKYPAYFTGNTVLDCGSLDINGNNRYLFDNMVSYTGIDIGAGNNVDIVSKIHEYKAESKYDFVISTECFEHDIHWKESFENILSLTSDGGMILFTCATTGRPEHGTRRTNPVDAPFVSSQDNEWSDYYLNLTEEDYKSNFDFDSLFETYEFSVNTESHDLYFYGIKK